MLTPRRGINEGRRAAAEVDEYLMGDTRLPVQSGIPKRSWIAPKVAHALNGSAALHASVTSAGSSELGTDDLSILSSPVTVAA
jgi:hypothetical protein